MINELGMQNGLSVQHIIEFVWRLTQSGVYTAKLQFYGGNFFGDEAMCLGKLGTLKVQILCLANSPKLGLDHESP
jgi:hypothetical protein